MADTSISDDDNLHDNGIVSRPMRIISSGISQDVEDLELNNGDQYEIIEDIEDHRFGDTALTRVQENDLLDSPEISSEEIMPIDRELASLEEIASVKSRYDEFVQFVMRQTPAKKRKILSEQYEKFKNGEGKNDIIILESNHYKECCFINFNNKL